MIFLKAKKASTMVLVTLIGIILGVILFLVIPGKIGAWLLGFFDRDISTAADDVVAAIKKIAKDENSKELIQTTLSRGFIVGFAEDQNYMGSGDRIATIIPDKECPDPPCVCSCEKANFWQVAGGGAAAFNQKYPFLNLVQIFQQGYTTVQDCAEEWSCAKIDDVDFGHSNRICREPEEVNLRDKKCMRAQTPGFYLSSVSEGEKKGLTIQNYNGLIGVCEDSECFLEGDKKLIDFEKKFQSNMWDCYKWTKCLEQEAAGGIVDPEFEPFCDVECIEAENNILNGIVNKDNSIQVRFRVAQGVPSTEFLYNPNDIEILKFQGATNYRIENPQPRFLIPHKYCIYGPSLDPPRYNFPFIIAFEEDYEGFGYDEIVLQQLNNRATLGIFNNIFPDYNGGEPPVCFNYYE